ncbi:acyltransferase family protein [Blastococcus xanthinilyticus]|uniref:Peptidoglycan/LPS O-acetylase OafA/YrhL n=1 Tax=Blastococcus xanthinilyticus TaxID=1564164 RepID=A0A5S5D1F1_9ACTN|nr:acyltransferase [Blastococcus xanthinilyticus]TYP89850.1 peptidoglycan/LPS O-acetylase OafA/YrhL [Blastococcus xanthinilyticus]
MLHIPSPAAAADDHPAPARTRYPRNHYIDLLKGFAALNIVFIHTVFNSGFNYVPDWVRAASLAVDVPFFFFLSGWAVASMPAIRFEKTLSSLWRIYSQWALFVVVTFAAMVVMAAATTVPLGSHREFLASFLGNLVLENPNTPLPFQGVMGGGWFLVVYFAVIPVMSLALAVIRRYTDSLRLVVFLLLLCVVGFVRVQAGGSFFFFDAYFLCYSAFFLVGYLQRDVYLRPWQAAVVIGVALVGLWTTLELRGAHLLDMQSLKFAPTLPWVFFSLLAIVAAMSAKPWQFRVQPRGPLNWVGKNALQFFFTNAVAASIVMFIEPHVALPWGAKLAACYAVTLAITAGFVLVFNWVYAVVSRRGSSLRGTLQLPQVVDQQVDHRLTAR